MQHIDIFDLVGGLVWSLVAIYLLLHIFINTYLLPTGVKLKATERAAVAIGVLSPVIVAARDFMAVSHHPLSSNVRFMIDVAMFSTFFFVYRRHIWRRKKKFDNKPLA